jgi:ribosomal protein S18 acetylase RimI-like enzyme
MAMLLRPAEPVDAMEVARVHVRSWQAAYRGLLPDAYLDELRPNDRAARYDFATNDIRMPATMVATDDGRICGFATTSPAHDSDVQDHGELCALYVDPECWGRGCGHDADRCWRGLGWRIRDFRMQCCGCWMAMRARIAFIGSMDGLRMG